MTTKKNRITRPGLTQYLSGSQSHHLHYLKQLQGGRIIDVSLNEDDIGAWPTLLVEMPGGKRMEIEIGSDPEGNAPGHLFIDHIHPEGK